MQINNKRVLRVFAYSMQSNFIRLQISRLGIICGKIGVIHQRLAAGFAVLVVSGYITAAAQLKTRNY